MTKSKAQVRRYNKKWWKEHPENTARYNQKAKEKYNEFRKVPVDDLLEEMGYDIRPHSKKRGFQ